MRKPKGNLSKPKGTKENQQEQQKTKELKDQLNKAGAAAKAVAKKPRASLVGKKSGLAQEETAASSTTPTSPMLAENEVAKAMT